MKRIKVTIKSLDGKVTNISEFDTHQEAMEFANDLKKRERPLGYFQEGIYHSKPQEVSESFEFVDGPKRMELQQVIEPEYLDGDTLVEEKRYTVEVEKCDLVCKVNQQYILEIEDLLDNKEYKNHIAKTNRKLNYGNAEEMLLDIYSVGITEWKKKIKKIHDMFPLDGE